MPKLLELLDLGGAVVPADAMHCQQKSSAVVTQELGWEYIWGLKGNQSGVLERAERLLEQQSFPP